MTQTLDLVAPDTALIQDAVRSALNAEDMAKAAIGNLITEKVVAGCMLAAKRADLPHGEWGAWIESNLPITRQTVRNWIKLAEFAKRSGADIENAQSVRHAYQLAGLLPEPDPESRGRTHVSPLQLAARFATTIEQQLAQMHRDELAQLRTTLERIVTRLSEIEAAPR
jgi:hypothetical protein